MAHVFRQQYTRPDPKRPGNRITKKSAKWYIQYRDSAGVWRRVPGFGDRKATEHLARELEIEAERIRSGYLPADVLQAKRPIAEHLGDYLAVMKAKPTTEKHVITQRSRIEAVVAGCNWSRWTDARASAVLIWLDAQRSTPRKDGEKGMAIETSNHYIRAVKSFFAWLAGAHFAGVNPLVTLKTANAETDRRRLRRSLSDADFRRLVAAARASSATLRGLDGPQRAALYVTAAYTGFRSSELNSLTPELLQIDGDPPTLTVQARYSKRRRLDEQPITADLAALLRAYLQGRSPGEPLWPGDWSPYRGAQLLRADLAAAGIPFEDAQQRRFDFHALRGQYITGLANAGVDMITAQKLARLSDPRLLAKHYARPNLGDLARSVDKLPALSAEEKKEGKRRRRG